MHPPREFRSGDLSAGQQVLWCERLDDRRREVMEVTVVEQQRSRWLVRDQAGRTFSTFATRLYDLGQADALSAWREAMFAVQDVDDAQPVDRLGALAADIVLCAAGSSLQWPGTTAIMGLLGRVGRDRQLAELHPAAFTDESAAASEDLVVPVCALVDLAEQLAGREPAWIIDRLDIGVRQAIGHVGDPDAPQVQLAVDLVRRWAGTPDAGAAGGSEREELIRLRSLLELAASMLDDAGRPDDGLRLRRAAFPHRFTATERS